MIARNGKKLEATRDRLAAKYAVDTVLVTMDLADPNLGDKVKEIAEAQDVGFLVYNAGRAFGNGRHMIRH